MKTEYNLGFSSSKKKTVAKNATSSKLPNKMVGPLMTWRKNYNDHILEKKLMGADRDADK